MSMHMKYDGVMMIIDGWGCMVNASFLRQIYQL